MGFGRCVYCFLICAGAVGVFGAAGDAAVDASGVYYNVPVTVLKENGNRSTGTGQLIAYGRDNGTSAIQLKLNIGPDTETFIVRRGDVPAFAAQAFGSVDKIVIPKNPMDRPRRPTSTLVDLLNENGDMIGEHYRIHYANGAPAEGLKLRYTVHRISSGGTVTLGRKGTFLVPKPAFSGQRFDISADYAIWAIEPVSGASIRIGNMSNNEPVTLLTVPFLRNWRLDSSDVHKFSGRISLNDDSAASGVGFKVMMVGYETPDNRVMVTQDLTAGPDGRFRLAYKVDPDLKIKNPSIRIHVDARGIGDEWHILKPGNNEIRTRREREMAVTLLNPDGEPMDFKTTPTLWENTTLHVDLPDGFLLETKISRNGVQAGLEANDDGTSPGLKPVLLPVPGEYVAMAPGYAFGPEKIGEQGNSMTFRPIIKQFSVVGKVTDVKGKPLEGAYVLAVDQFMTISMNQNEWTSDKLARLWERTEGEFEKLSGYMAQTDERGIFEFGGETLGQAAVFFVGAPGYGAVRRVIVRGIVPGGTPHDPIADLAGSRLSGKNDAGTIALAKSATVTLVLANRETTDTMSLTRIGRPRAYVRAEFLADDSDKTTAAANAKKLSKRHSRWQTHSRQERSPENGVIYTLSVPAETTFTLTVESLQFGKDAERSVLVEEPLIPGETRDLGLVE